MRGIIAGTLGVVGFWAFMFGLINYPDIVLVGIGLLIMLGLSAAIFIGVSEGLG